MITITEEIQSVSSPPPAESSKPYLPVWGPWPTTGLGLAIFAINTLAQAGVLITLAAREFLANPDLDILTMANNLITDGFMVSLAVIVSGAVGVVVTILFIKARRRASIREYLALVPLTRKQILISLGVTAGLVALLELISAMTGQVPDTGINLELYRTADPIALLWVAFVIFAPAFEEIFFRGFLFAGWERSRLGPVGTIILTSVLWAVLHVQYDLFGIVSILIMGIAIGIMRHKTKSLWSPLLMHFAWNLTGMTMLALYPGGG